MPASPSFSCESVQRCRQRCGFAAGSADLATLSQRFKYQKCYLCKLQPQNGGHPPLVLHVSFPTEPLQTLLKAGDGVCERCENADTPRDGQMDDDERGREGEECRQREEVTAFSSTIPVCLLSTAECACFPICVCVLVLFLSPQYFGTKTSVNHVRIK